MASILLPGSSHFFRAFTALLRSFLSPLFIKFHSSSALLRRYPASCSRVSSSLQAFHVAERCSEGSQSSKLLLPLKVSIGGAFPLREAAPLGGGGRRSFAVPPFGRVSALPSESGSGERASLSARRLCRLSTSSYFNAINSSSRDSLSQ